MKHRPWLKRFLLIGLPLGLLIAVWMVQSYSPMFEGRRWLWEQGRSAVGMRIICYHSTPRSQIAEIDPVYISNHEEIQGLLEQLEPVGSLSGQTHLSSTSSGFGRAFDITLFYPDGRNENLSLKPPDKDSDLVRYQSSNRLLLDSSLGLAHVRKSSYWSFVAAFDVLKKKSR